MTLAEFRVRFPEFSKASDALVNAVLAEAALQVDDEIFNDQYDAAHGHLAAHLLCLSPYGQAARLAEPGKPTTYQVHYERLMYANASGFRVC
jgi:hypothetical protein